MSCLVVVIPVKPLTVAKSRIDLTAARRSELAVSMFRDTLRAVTRSSRVLHVVCVTSDPVVASVAEGAGAHIAWEGSAARTGDRLG